MKKSEILFVITTWNQSEYTKICLDSLKLIDEKCDILVIDDASTDNTIDLCNTYDIEVISKKEGMGLTDSWNKSYRYFVDNNYSYFRLNFLKFIIIYSCFNFLFLYK